MKCHVCGNEIIGSEFLPFPFGGSNGEKCCRTCFEGQVAEAYKLYNRCEHNKYPELDDEIVIFYLEEDFLRRKGIDWKEHKLKRGFVTEIDENLMIFKGTWGNFEVCPPAGDIIGIIG